MSVEAVVEQRGGRNGWGCGGYPDLEMGGAFLISSSKAIIKRWFSPKSFWRLTFLESVRNQLPTCESVRV